MQLRYLVNKIKRYEAGTSQPTLNTLARLAKELHTSLDELVFGDAERDPRMSCGCNLKRSAVDKEDRKVAKAVMESLILKHNAKRVFIH